MGSSLDAELQGMLDKVQPERGPQGGDLQDPRYYAERRRASFNAVELPEGPALHRFEREDSCQPGLKNEQAWHRMAAHMILMGMSNKEIANAASVHPATVSILKAQRWFQELLAVLANEAGAGALALVQSEAVQSVLTLAELRDDAEAPPSVRLQAAKALMEQSMGKPTQRIESNVRTHSVSPQEEMEELQREIEALRRRDSGVETLQNITSGAEGHDLPSSGHDQPNPSVIDI
jgi:transposase